MKKKIQSILFKTLARLAPIKATTYKAPMATPTSFDSHSHANTMTPNTKNTIGIDINRKSAYQTVKTVFMVLPNK